jgi:hypothetical protein
MNSVPDVCDHMAVCILQEACTRMGSAGVSAPMGTIFVRSEQPMNWFHLNRPHNHNHCIRCRVVSCIKTDGTIVIASCGDTNRFNKNLNVPFGLYPMPLHLPVWRDTLRLSNHPVRMLADFRPGRCFCQQHLFVFSNGTAATRCVLVINHFKQVTVWARFSQNLGHMLYI